MIRTLLLSILLSVFSTHAFAGRIHDLVKNANAKELLEYLEQNPNAVLELNDEGLSVFDLVDISNEEVVAILIAYASDANASNSESNQQNHNSEEKKDEGDCPICLCSLSDGATVVSTCCLTPLHASCRDGMLNGYYMEHTTIVDGIERHNTNHIRLDNKCPVCKEYVYVRDFPERKFRNQESKEEKKEVKNEKEEKNSEEILLSAFLTDEQVAKASILAEYAGVDIEIYLQSVNTGNDLGQLVDSAYHAHMNRNRNNNNNNNHNNVHNRHNGNNVNNGPFVIQNVQNNLNLNGVQLEQQRGYCPSGRCAVLTTLTMAILSIVIGMSLGT